MNETNNTQAALPRCKTLMEFLDHTVTQEIYAILVENVELELPLWNDFYRAVITILANEGTEESYQLLLSFMDKQKTINETAKDNDTIGELVQPYLQSKNPDLSLYQQEVLSWFSNAKGEFSLSMFFKKIGILCKYREKNTNLRTPLLVTAGSFKRELEAFAGTSQVSPVDVLSRMYENNSYIVTHTMPHSSGVKKGVVGIDTRGGKILLEPNFTEILPFHSIYKFSSNSFDEGHTDASIYPYQKFALAKGVDETFYLLRNVESDDIYTIQAIPFAAGIQDISDYRQEVYQLLAFYKLYNQEHYFLRHLAYDKEFYQKFVIIVFCNSGNRDALRCFFQEMVPGKGLEVDFDDGELMMSLSQTYGVGARELQILFTYYKQYYLDALPITENVSLAGKTVAKTHVSVVKSAQNLNLNQVLRSKQELLLYIKQVIQDPEIFFDPTTIYDLRSTIENTEAITPERADAHVSVFRALLDESTFFDLLKNNGFVEKFKNLTRDDVEDYSVGLECIADYFSVYIGEYWKQGFFVAHMIENSPQVVDGHIENGLFSTRIVLDILDRRISQFNSSEDIKFRETLLRNLKVSAEKTQRAIKDFNYYYMTYIKTYLLPTKLINYLESAISKTMEGEITLPSIIETYLLSILGNDSVCDELIDKKHVFAFYSGQESNTFKNFLVSRLHGYLHNANKKAINTTLLLTDQNRSAILGEIITQFLDHADTFEWYTGNFEEKEDSSVPYSFITHAYQFRWFLDILEHFFTKEVYDNKTFFERLLPSLENVVARLSVKPGYSHELEKDENESYTIVYNQEIGLHQKQINRIISLLQVILRGSAKEQQYTFLGRSMTGSEIITALQTSYYAEEVLLINGVPLYQGAHKFCIGQSKFFDAIDLSMIPIGTKHGKISVFPLTEEMLEKKECTICTGDIVKGNLFHSDLYDNHGFFYDYNQPTIKGSDHGNRIGGARIYVSKEEKIVFLYGESKGYGPIHMRAVERYLKKYVPVGRTVQVDEAFGEEDV